MLHSDLNTFLYQSLVISQVITFALRGKECVCIFGNTSGLCWMKRTLKLRKISRHYRILGSVMRLVFLVSRCFKNTHHMSFSPDVMHIFCQSPRLHSSPFFSLLHLDHIIVKLRSKSRSSLSSLITVDDKEVDINVPYITRPSEPYFSVISSASLERNLAPLVHNCPTNCQGGQPHKTV